jgi:hypothetical protein
MPTHWTHIPHTSTSRAIHCRSETEDGITLYTKCYATGTCEDPAVQDVLSRLRGISLETVLFQMLRGHKCFVSLYSNRTDMSFQELLELFKAMGLPVEKSQLIEHLLFLLSYREFPNENEKDFKVPKVPGLTELIPKYPTHVTSITTVDLRHLIENQLSYNVQSTVISPKLRYPMLHVFLRDMTIPAKVKKIVLAKLIFAVALLHEHDVSHNDLHFGNVLIYKDADITTSYPMGSSRFQVPSTEYYPVIFDFDRAALAPHHSDASYHHLHPHRALYVPYYSRQRDWNQLLHDTTAYNNHWVPNSLFIGPDPSGYKKCLLKLQHQVFSNRVIRRTHLKSNAIELFLHFLGATKIQPRQSTRRHKRKLVSQSTPSDPKKHKHA